MTRFFDILFATLGLLVLIPLLLPLAILLRLTGEGEIFYRQRRVGKGGQIFGLLKFATMLKDSPNLATGDITVKNDPRILPYGNFLRKTKINELPQIWNILTGDMSVVGPRPMTEKNYSYYPEEVRNSIASVRPGLTGIGSLIFRNEENILDDMPDKIEFVRLVVSPYKGALEKWYVEHAGLLNYFMIIFFTALVIVSPGSRLFLRFFAKLPKPPAELKEKLKL